MSDPISEWAGHLHPDGAPGQGEAAMRTQMGDRNYEIYRDHTHGLWERDRAFRDQEVRRHRARVDLRRALILAVLVGCALAVGWSFWTWVVIR